MVEAAGNNLAHRRDIRLGIIVVCSSAPCSSSPRADLRSKANSSPTRAQSSAEVDLRPDRRRSAYRRHGRADLAGGHGPIDLRITNHHDVTLSVTRLVVAMGPVTAPNADARRPCSVEDFALVQVRGTLQLPLAAHSTKALGDLGVDRATWPRVGMVDRRVNQDGCKGASLTLFYTGSGTLGD